MDQADYSQLNTMGLVACQAAYEEGGEWLEQLKAYLQEAFDRLAEAALLEYPWPGNIRELKNVIGRAVLICQEQWISVSDLNLEISLPKEEETQWTEEEKEKALLLQTLEKTGDNRSKAARLLNVSRTTLYEKLRKYHIID